MDGGEVALGDFFGVEERSQEFGGLVAAVGCLGEELFFVEAYD